MTQQPSTQTSTKPGASTSIAHGKAAAHAPIALGTNLTKAALKTNLHDAFLPFLELDLDEVAQRVAKEQPSWDDARLDTAVLEYRRWLYLCKIAPKGEGLGMCSADVDEIWHAHILFTHQYATDCRRLIGHFLHHAPTSEEEKAKGDDTASRSTRELYLTTFKVRSPTWFGGGGEDCTGETCHTGGCHGCAMSCKTSYDGCQYHCQAGTCSVNY